MEPKFVIFTDIHLKPGNEEEVFSACEEIVSYCKENHLRDALCLGDVFDSRIAQRQSVLTCWSDCLNLFNENDITLHVLRGNHDTAVYDEHDSFLEAYRDRPNFDLLSILSARRINDIVCWFLPYYTDQVLIEELSHILEPEKNNYYLFGHFSIQGSQNQGVEIESKLSRDLFKGFKKVILGHFHDYQEVSKQIVHLGSLFQNNFGETDKNKGFWVFYEDGSIKNIPLKEKISYKKIEIDLSSITEKQAVSLINKFKKDNPNDKLRVEIFGEASTVKAFDKSRFEGIDIKKKYIEIEKDLDIEEREIKSLSQQDIVEKFKVFCKENDYNYKEGLTILNEIICQ